jgi:prevent-host-death family protein
MKTTTIRELKHDMSTVLSWVAAGETVEVTRRGEPVAVLGPAGRKPRVARPDYAARLKTIYGRNVAAMTGTDLVSEARGES